jgi:hypothetical protein
MPAMNVLLVYPEYPVTFWSFKYALKFIGKKSAYPPLGLLTVAALLPRQWSRRVVDVNVDKLTAEDLAWADMVFVGAMAIQRASAEAIIDRCKARGLKVVGAGRCLPWNRNPSNMWIISCWTKRK